MLIYTDLSSVGQGAQVIDIAVLKSFSVISSPALHENLSQKFLLKWLKWEAISLYLEIIMLSEISQSEKDKYHMISLMYRI